jgi:hypothetical protein
MLKQEVYEKASDMFGVTVGVANVMGYTKFEDTKKEYTPVKYKKASDELDINMIINRVIELGKYKPFQKILYKINDKAKNRRIKELTIYKKAWKELNGTI